MQRGKLAFPRQCSAATAQARRWSLARAWGKIRRKLRHAKMRHAKLWHGPIHWLLNLALCLSIVGTAFLLTALVHFFPTHALPIHPAEAPPPELEIEVEIEVEPHAAVFFSELMIHPRAVSNLHGEWIELYNGDSEPVNLRNWSIVAHAVDQHRITQDIWIQPGAYVILANHGNPTENGGVQPAYVYTNLQLANWSETIILTDDAGRVVDRFQTTEVRLSGNSRPARIGASVERTGFGPDDIWVEAHAPWPGSLGDWGSPGQGYTTPPAVESPTPTPAAVITPPSTPPIVRISEVMADPHAVYDEVG